MPLNLDVIDGFFPMVESAFSETIYTRVEWVNTGNIAWPLNVLRDEDEKAIMVRVADLDVLREHPSLETIDSDAVVGALRAHLEAIPNKKDWRVYVMPEEFSTKGWLLYPVQRLRVYGSWMVIEIAG